MLRRVLLAAVAVGALTAGLPRVAEAAVTYTLVDQVYEIGDLVPTPVGPRTGLSFTISDAAVARGSFNLQFSGSGRLENNVVFGDIADFVSLTVADREVVRLDQGIMASQSFLTATFNSDATLTSLDFQYRGVVEDLTLVATSANLVSGTFVSEAGGEGCFSLPTRSCGVTGRIVATDVPEPMSLALLGMGLLGIAAVRRTA